MNPGGVVGRPGAHFGPSLAYLGIHGTQGPSGSQPRGVEPALTVAVGLITRLADWAWRV